MIKNSPSEIRFSFMIHKSGLTKKGNIPAFISTRMKRVPCRLKAKTKHRFCSKGLEMQTN